ncbi:8220_t:CDS:2 [Ambispora leptoticha]|uniref:8220_t:CDS:1 n=1 Tax=Ambispora leptoticha TaxID=144679 RepID=A0A9N8W8M1_9GLOM|nr:8220_t:CDS:2 [Ambispora leptoticha]
MATLILPTTLSDMEDLLPGFLERSPGITDMCESAAEIRRIAQKKFNTPSPPSSPLHDTTLL